MPAGNPGTADGRHATYSHRLPLERAPEAYETFKNKTEDCTNVVLTP
jgi:threonine dehydrogenase-like Zn-dependent dehydrogenase